MSLEPPIRRTSTGLGLVAALFLVLVVALLVAAINRTVVSGAERTSLTLLDHRALLTAHNGAQLSLNRLYAPAGGAGSCNGTTFAMTDIPTLRNCDATVTCGIDSVRGRTFYTVTATGVCMDGATTSRRQVLVRTRDL